MLDAMKNGQARRRRDPREDRTTAAQKGPVEEPPGVIASPEEEAHLLVVQREANRAKRAGTLILTPWETLRARWGI
jgi:hypothetical protein